MAEYIEREKAWRKVNRADSIEKALDEIDKIPAADVVEVRHGEWIAERCNHKPYRLNNPEKWVKYKCSECGYSNGRKHSNYCPNCGAKMDGKGEEE